MTVVTAMVSIAVAMSITVGTTVSVAVVGISLSLSLSGPLAPGHGSEGSSGQTVGVVVAMESRVDVVVQDSNTVSVAVVGIGISAPLAVVVSDKTVETLGRPGNVGGGNSGVGSNAKTESVAVSVVSVGAPLSVSVVSTGSIDGALVAVADSGGPGGGDTAGSDKGVSVAVVSISLSIS